MFLASPPIEDLEILDAAVIALLGYAVVFFGLVLLMIVVTLLGKALSKTSGAKKPEPQAAPAAAPVAAASAAPAPVVTQQPAADGAAPGSAGKLKLHDVPPKTAAMLMAIVADKMGKPLNELRFISIKEDK